MVNITNSLPSRLDMDWFAPHLNVSSPLDTCYSPSISARVANPCFRDVPFLYMNINGYVESKSIIRSLSHSPNLFMISPIIAPILVITAE